MKELKKALKEIIKMSEADKLVCLKALRVYLSWFDPNYTGPQNYLRDDYTWAETIFSLFNLPAPQFPKSRGSWLNPAR